MKKIFVSAKANAIAQKVAKIDENHYNISVTEEPKKGRANFVIGKLLASELKIPQTEVKLIRGYSSKNKIFGIN